MGLRGDHRQNDGSAHADGQDYRGARSQIDSSTEELLSLSEAARCVPKLNGRRVHASTVFRWCRRGLRGVRLEYVRIGRRMATSKEALDRFFNALAAADGEPPEPRRAPKTEKSPNSTARARAIAQAEARLEKAGL